jgi:hypothetical protein
MCMCILRFRGEEFWFKFQPPESLESLSLLH